MDRQRPVWVQGRRLRPCCAALVRRGLFEKKLKGVPLATSMVRASGHRGHLILSRVNLVTLCTSHFQAESPKTRELILFIFNWKPLQTPVRASMSQGHSPRGQIESPPKGSLAGDLVGAARPPSRSLAAVERGAQVTLPVPASRAGRSAARA